MEINKHRIMQASQVESYIKNNVLPNGTCGIFMSGHNLSLRQDMMHDSDGDLAFVGIGDTTSLIVLGIIPNGANGILIDPDNIDYKKARADEIKYIKHLDQKRDPHDKVIFNAFRLRQELRDGECTINNSGMFESEYVDKKYDRSKNKWSAGYNIVEFLLDSGYLKPDVYDRDGIPHKRRIKPSSWYLKNNAKVAVFGSNTPDQSSEMLRLDNHTNNVKLDLKEGRVTYDE